MLDGGELPDQMDMPRLAGPSFDQVLLGGELVGVSTGRTVSPTLRAMISLCVIDRAHAAPGTAVTVIWGRPGTPQREIRATVTALPFKPDHRRVDVTAL
jgi:vanillate/3-O-methylgallate O-demethylase